MQAGSLPWEVVCRSVVDAISLVFHMSRVEGHRSVEEARQLNGWRAEDNAWVTDAFTPDSVPIILPDLQWRVPPPRSPR